MKLNKLIDCDYEIDIKGISNNSKEVKAGDLFVCTKGVTADRHDFIDAAIKNGAVAAIVSKPVDVLIPTVMVENTNQVFIDLLQKFYEYPSTKMKMIGVTGTDGKTSVATIISELINLTSSCGYIGTNGVSSKHYCDDNPNTTPGPEKLQPFLYHLQKSGCEYTSIEVTSEALAQNRVAGIDFDVSVLTNITSDHINIHGSIENYVKEKSKLFSKTKKEGYCILNVDDEHYQEVKAKCSGNIVTYGIEGKADFQAFDIELLPQKTLFKLRYQGHVFEIESPLECMFNVYNLTAALATLTVLGFNLEETIHNLTNIHVDGRMNHISLGQDFMVLIDYAHTINGISKLFESIKKIYNANYIAVTGIAGERDYTKRPKIGEIFIQHASHTIFTSEDPRGENPYKIIDELLTNVKDQESKYSIEVNRMLAIRKAIHMAKKGDVILILGKGTEDYQKIAGEAVYFNDYEAAKSILMEKLYTEKIKKVDIK